jgi:hypothetical protein
LELVDFLFRLDLFSVPMKENRKSKIEFQRVKLTGDGTMLGLFCAKHNKQ